MVEILPGHGPVVTDPAGWLAFYRTHRLERLDQVRAALAGGARYAGARSWPRCMPTSTAASGPLRSSRCARNWTI